MGKDGKAMELRGADKARMIDAIVQDYYFGVLEAATDNPGTFLSYYTMACHDPASLARSFANSMRLILEQKPIAEIHRIYAEL